MQRKTAEYERERESRWAPMIRSRVFFQTHTSHTHLALCPSHTNASTLTLTQTQSSNHSSISPTRSPLLVAAFVYAQSWMPVVAGAPAGSVAQSRGEGESGDSIWEARDNSAALLGGAENGEGRWVNALRSSCCCCCGKRRKRRNKKPSVWRGWRTNTVTSSCTDSEETTSGDQGTSRLRCGGRAGQLVFLGESSAHLFLQSNKHFSTLLCDPLMCYETRQCTLSFVSLFFATCVFHQFFQFAIFNSHLNRQPDEPQAAPVIIHTSRPLRHFSLLWCIPGWLICSLTQLDIRSHYLLLFYCQPRDGVLVQPCKQSHCVCVCHWLPFLN